MKYFLLILISMTLIHCERDKASLAGSYKLERSGEQALEDKSYYGLKTTLNQKKDSFDFEVVAYSDKTHLALKTVKDGGALALKSITNDGKRYLQIHIKDKANDSDIILNLPLETALKEPKPVDFVYDNIVFSAVYRCHDERCESIKFSIKGDRPNDITRIGFKGIAFFWILTPVDNTFIFKTVCQMANPNNSKKLIDEPFYLLHLPRESAELKCFDY